jgi:phage terminase small subunit
MKGRHPKSAKLLLYEKKSHKAKAEIGERLKSEIKIGDSIFMAPDFICNDPVAFSKWNETLSYFQDAPTQGLVTSSDTDIIAQYCACFSEQKYLIEQRAKAKSEKKKIKFTTAILKNREMLLKLSNHLYLNPVAKARCVPRKKTKEETPLEKAGFGFI